MRTFNFFKEKDYLITLFKWTSVSFISILLSNYLINRLLIVNNFLEVLFTSTILSIMVQAVRSHDHEFSFRMRWFIFYFLAYSIIIWVMKDYIIPELFSKENLFSYLLTGFIIGALILLVEKAGVRSRTIPWISLVLLLMLIIGNLPYLNGVVSSSLLPQYINSEELSESKKACPSQIGLNSTGSLSSSFLNGLIDSSIWRIEREFDSCYKGKYAGQYPDRFYCDNLIVSRWDTSSSGTINYRWYTAINSEWALENIGRQTFYTLKDFTCDNGKKVTVRKESKQYYVHYARDGTPIRVEY